MIAYHTQEQELLAKKSKADLEKSGQLRKGTIVTEIVPASTFYQAEDYIRNIIKREAVEAVTTIQYKRFKISTHVYTRNQVRSN